MSHRTRSLGGFGHGGFGGGGGFARGFTGGGFARGGVARSFAAPGIAGRNFAPGGRVFADRGFARGDFRHRFGDRGFGRRFSGGSALGLGLGLGYGYYNDACYAWTPRLHMDLRLRLLIEANTGTVAGPTPL
jgi:hypothetical protein